MTEIPRQMKVIVVSGSTGYVGSAIVKKLAEEGFSIAMLYRPGSEDRAAHILYSLSGSTHVAYECDIQGSARVREVVSEIEKKQGNIYGSVHAAGTLPRPKQLHLSSLDEVREQFEVDVFGAFNFLSVCAEQLKVHKQGIIIAITTAGVVSRINTKARGVYSMTKFAVQGALTALKEELASSGVRVYSIAPGVMPGGLNEATPRAFIDMVREKSPTKKLASVEDVAELVSKLCTGHIKPSDELTFLVAPESEDWQSPLP